MNTTPAPLPPLRRNTRGQVVAVILGVLAVLFLSGVVAAIAAARADQQQPEPPPASEVAESPAPSPSPVPSPTPAAEPTEESEPEETEAEPPPEPEETEEPAPPPPPPETDPRFGTCAEAIAAGYGPYFRGQDPEYDWYRDADSDGVVCER